MVSNGAVTDQASISIDLFSHLPRQRRISVWPMPHGDDTRRCLITAIAPGHFIPIFLDGDAAQRASASGASMN
jgi:hypothetical protein